jgi:hypothetical protein
MNLRTSAEVKAMVAELAQANHRSVAGTIEWLIRTEYAEHVHARGLRPRVQRRGK